MLHWLQIAIQEIRRLEDNAEKTTNPDMAFNLYERALGICSSHNFKHRAAKIYCKRAERAFKVGNLSGAMQDADSSIDNDPDYLEVS